MIVLKYNKANRARFISHIDTLKHITRTIRRAGVDIEYSQGYNPHMLIKLSAPCPLGIGSIAEYMAVQCTNVSADEFLKLYNRYSPEDMTGYKSWETDKNPNLQGVVEWADYTMKNEIDLDYNEVMNLDKLEITYDIKGKKTTKDVRHMIDILENRADGIFMRLALGNNTLRPDRFVEYINNHYGINLSVTDIIRAAQYTIKDDKLIDFDNYLNEMEKER